MSSSTHDSRSSSDSQTEGVSTQQTLCTARYRGASSMYLPCRKSRVTSVATAKPTCGFTSRRHATEMGISSPPSGYRMPKACVGDAECRTAPASGSSSASESSTPAEHPAGMAIAARHSSRHPISFSTASRIGRIHCTGATRTSSVGLQRTRPSSAVMNGSSGIVATMVQKGGESLMKLRDKITSFCIVHARLPLTA